MKKGSLFAVVAAFFGILVFILVNRENTDSVVVRFDNTPTMDEQWSKVATIGEWVKDRSSFAFQENTLPYTYRLKTNDSLVGCAVTPVYQNSKINGMLFGVVIFEESTGFVTESGYTTVDSTGKVLSAPITTNVRYDFNTACKQYVSKLPSEIARYIL